MVARIPRAYVPDAADVVWVDFDAQAGHEQAGRRPAVVLSPRIYNEKAGLAILCPITTRIKGYPFEVGLPPGLQVHGAILADQLKSLDWLQRRVQKFAKVPSSVLEQVRKRVATLIGIS